MSKHDPKVTLRQITDFAQHAQELCTQNDLPAILTDWHKRLAFERVMEVLGEAVKRLPSELCRRYPAVPWELIAGMRDRVSHGYDAIDYATLWDTVRDDVTGLLATVGQMLNELDWNRAAPSRRTDLQNQIFALHRVAVLHANFVHDAVE